MRGVVVLVESNTTGTGRLFARHARAFGDPLMIVADPARYPYLTEDGVRHEVVDTADVAAVIRSCRRTGRPVRAVTTSSDHFLRVAATVAERLGLPGPSAPALTRNRHKGRQRKALRDAGVPVPDWHVASTVAEAVDAARELGFPVVVKPVEGSGSVGVRLVGDEQAMVKQAQVLLVRARNERGMPVTPQVSVERHVVGREFSVELFDGELVAVVEKRLGPLPAFVEIGHDVPAVVPDPVRDRLVSTAVRAVHALGLVWGAAHVELRYAAGCAVVIEVNPRLAGGLIPELVRRAGGGDLVHAQVAAAAGVSVSAGTLAPPGDRAAVIRFLTAAGQARVADPAVALAAARAVPGVVAAELYRGAGDHVTPAVDFLGRVGHVIATGRDPGGTAGAADRGLAALACALTPDGVAVGHV